MISCSPLARRFAKGGLELLYEICRCAKAGGVGDFVDVQVAFPQEHLCLSEARGENLLAARLPEAGELAKAVGGHGGMDFLMDLRWVYCLQNGLPLDMDVYDLATWCSICELSERSVRSGSKPQDVPDFTRGGWKTAKPLGIEGIDMTKLDFDRSRIDNSSGQMNI